jgi:S1-C subfamily serine protease
MDANNQRETPVGTAFLEHLTGPSRGTVTPLTDSTLDIFLSPKRFIHVSQTPPGDAEDHLVARLHRADDTYEIEAMPEREVWVNRERVHVRQLEDRDIVEFEQSGPMSRFRLDRHDRPVRRTVAELLYDAAAYVRVSRQPPARRMVKAVFGFLRRLAGETTVLFRISVACALVALGVFAYQQNRMNALLQQRIETGAAQLESFARALARAREEALTPADLQALRQEIATRVLTNAERLEVLERRSQATAAVIAKSIASVAFLQGAYGFREEATGRMLRHVVDKEGRPLISPIGQPLLSLEGDGPVAERQFTGTGFAVENGSILVTNRHVAMPWENDSDVKALTGQGLQPTMIKFLAYLPGEPAASNLELHKASDEADLAILRRTGDARSLPALELARAVPNRGDEVIVMGYPTGLRSMLVQAGEGFIKSLQDAEDTDFWSVARRLAEDGHIVPLASRGIVGQVTAATIVYDAETTHGGSGGPVLSVEGTVVAVNAAILPEYGGSNLGVPAARVLSMLQAAATD